MPKMRFAVLDPAGESIVDPETGNEIGSIRKVKVEVEVVQVGEKLSLARTFRSWTVNVGGQGVGAGGYLAKLMEPPKYEKRYESLKTSEKDWEPLTEEESYVQVGDPVEQVVDVEDADRVTGVIASSADSG